MPDAKTYIAIDLKSFYASAECVARGLNPLTTNLVVADASRTDKTICLAITPSLKAHGIGGRARLFEVNQQLAAVNAVRRNALPDKRFKGKSVFQQELDAHPDWKIDYMIAVPRMAYYIDVSTHIYDIYLRYIAPEDIHVYSIDEVFIDATPYLFTYRMTGRELAKKMISDVLAETGITATAGIGTNLYLCKVAMDIMAKHTAPDSNGMRIAELDEMSYRQHLWNHRPLTDFWRIGRGVAKHLAAWGIETMGQLARFSLQYEELLYHRFGVNAELIIDHAWGYEPCTMADIKAYHTETHSFCNGQVLATPHDAMKARVVIQEMAENIALRLTRKGLVTAQIVLSVGYDSTSLTNPSIRNAYQGKITTDRYGRPVPVHGHGSTRFREGTSSIRIITHATADLFDRVVDKNLYIRYLNLTAANILPAKIKPVQLDLFDPPLEDMVPEAAKEQHIQQTILDIKEKFGNNSILRGLNFAEGATARDRNRQIGGHKA